MKVGKYIVEIERIEETEFEVTITSKDGSAKPLAEFTTTGELAANISKGLALVASGAKLPNPRRTRRCKHDAG